jgi:ABC-2 type transport system ATP-binding protein
MDDIAIRAENLSKDFVIPHEKHSSIKSIFVNFYKRKRTYELQHALKDVNFEVKKGEFFGIVGRNGSGKSTLLKIMAGIYTPTSGSVKVNGSLTPFIELGVGFNPELTGRENVFLNGALLGFNRKRVRAMYKEIVEFAELEKFMDLKLKNFSSGMQVRLAFSIAIRAQGDVLLLDEVLAVGDSAFQRKCLEFFRDIKKTGRTVVLVTHNMGTVEEFCDRAMMIENSKIAAIGNPMKISAQYEVANSIYTKKVSKETKNESPNYHKKTDIQIKKATTYSSAGQTTEFGLAEDVHMEVEIEVIKKQPFYINLALYDMAGEYIAGINSKDNIALNELSKGTHKLKCVIVAGQLPNGAYHPVINIIKDDETQALIDVASHEYGVDVPIITFTEKSQSKKGKFYISANWQLDKH